MNARRRSLVFLVVNIFLFIFIAGCQENNDQNLNSLRWSEDVKLHDGRVIRLTRYQEFKGPHELGQPPSASNYWFEFNNPESNELIKWQQSSMGEYLVGVALVVQDGTSYLLTMPVMGNSWEKHKCPNPAYILYKKEEGADWIMAPLQELPVKKIRANMTFDAQSKASIIRRNNYVLKEDQTSNSYIGAQQEFAIDISGVGEQKFDWPNCGEFNLSLKK